MKEIEDFANKSSMFLWLPNCEWFLLQPP